MYAVGHFALGYLAGKVSSRTLNVNLNLPLIFLASVFPDIDLIIPGLEHRGPLHSVIVYCLLFLPLFFYYRKRAIPYFLALTQHIIFGDFITGKTQLLWPASVDMIGLGVDIASLTNIALEWFLFISCIAIMFKTKDVLLLVKQQSSNLILSVPVLTVLLPTVVSFPLYVPLELLIPHLAFLTLFVFSILMDWKPILKK
jgi:membrane-bound metal-dependent hydrolase YbcI (DUF457 family)